MINEFRYGQPEEFGHLVYHFTVPLRPEIGYDTAIMLLNKRYGNPHLLLASYRQEIKPLALVKPGDAIGIRKFHDFVLKCETFFKITNWDSLETPETSCSCVKTAKWFRRQMEQDGTGYKEELWQGTMFVRFFQICKRENNIGQRPKFFREAVQEYMTHPEKKLNNHNKKVNFAIHSTKEVFMI